METDQYTQEIPPRSYRRSKAGRTDRARWCDQVSAANLSPGCTKWALLLACRSNAAAKPVWGYQTGQAAAIGRCERSVRTYRAELEQAGLIEVDRGEVHRNPDGTFCRQMTNRYRLIVPPRPRKPRPSRPAADCRINPVSTRQLETLETNIPKFVEDEPPPKAWTFERGLIGAAKSQLRRSRTT